MVDGDEDGGEEQFRNFRSRDFRRRDTWFARHFLASIPESGCFRTIRMSFLSQTIRAVPRLASRSLNQLAIHGPNLHAHALARQACPRTRASVALMSRRKFSPYARNVLSFRLGWATSTTPHSTASDPAEVEALRCLEQGTLKLEEGDIPAAKTLYQRSAEIKRNASSLFNLGVTHYHLSVFDSCCYVCES